MKIGKETVLVRVFLYDEEVSKYIILPEDNDGGAIRNDMNLRTLPWAWVVAAGDEAKFNGEKIERGDIMRLWDWKARSIENPKYRAFYENDGSDSNADIQGIAPPKLVHRIYDYYGDSVTFIDPLKEPDIVDYFTFNIPSFDFMGHLKDPKVLLR